MQIDAIALIEKHAKKCGVPPRVLCGLAGVDPTNWWHWTVKGRSPRVSALNKILAVDPKQARRSA